MGFSKGQRVLIKKSVFGEIADNPIPETGNISGENI
jgi:hypothetical protein